MTLPRDEIVDIPANRLRYFGGPGRMLLPCPATVEAFIARLPDHTLSTTSFLYKQLAAEFHVEGTCPVTTRKALQAIATQPNAKAAYWRVIKANGELTSILPGGVDAQAKRLREEGFAINTRGKSPRVEDFRANLAHFE